MFVDGLEVTDDSRVTRHLMDPSKRGTVFPASPANGDVFELVESASGHAPGIYTYVGVESRWVAKYPNFDVIPYDISGAVFGTMSDADIISRHISVRSYKLSQGFAGSIAAAAVAPAATCNLTIIRVGRNGYETQLGTLSFAAASTEGSFVQSGSGDMIITAGESLVIQAPNPVDTTIADIAFTFAGSLL